MRTFIYPQPIPLHRHDCWLLVVMCHLSSHLSTMIILIYTGYMIYGYSISFDFSMSNRHFFLLIQMWNSRKIIALQDFRSFQLFEPLCLCVSFGRAHPSSEISRLRPTSHRLLFLKPCSMIFQGKLTQFTVVVTISHQPSGDLSQ